MRQERFVARYGQQWDEFEAWLDARAGKVRDVRRAGIQDVRWRGMRDDAVPGAYRRLCHQLSLARRRGYSPQVVDRLQGLMQRGHAMLYRPPPVRWRAALMFIAAGFPRLVRSEWRCMLASLLLFAIPLLGMFAAIQLQPALVHSVFDPEDVAQFERMYEPGGARLGRDSGGDLAMFGHYVYNNVTIGFRTFAAGLLAGIGSALVLLLNGVMIGTVGGHLQQIGYGDPFWRFVCGHSALELTAIVIAGGAGLQLGLRLLVPGNRRRRDALVEGGRRGGLLCLGVLLMLVLAAFVEAFWSSIGWMPAWIKYAVAATLWSLVLLWLWRGGRSGHDGHIEAADAA